MAGMGTGTPLFFRCPKLRRVWYTTSKYHPEILRGLEDRHEVHRTGRTKPNHSHRRTQRTLNEQHEFVCSCGHRGWSRISDILRFPIVGES